MSTSSISLFSALPLSGDDATASSSRTFSDSSMLSAEDFDNLANLLTTAVRTRVDSNDPPGKPPASVRLLRIGELAKLVGLSRATIYTRLKPSKDGGPPDFPSPVHLGASGRSPVRWRSDEVERWIKTRPRSR